MKLAFQLAYKNLIGAGLRTWLNAIVLSFAFVMILFYNGLMDGWNLQATRDAIDWEYGQGQVHFSTYDPYDPFTILDGHGQIPNTNQEIAPVLIQQASIYPDGRLIPVSLKGIKSNQNILHLPTKKLITENPDEITAVIGKRMAETAGLSVGDQVLLRWRDAEGMFDAQDVTITEIFDTNVPSTDVGTIWIDIDKLWQMTNLENEATILVLSEEGDPSLGSDWVYQSKSTLLQTLAEMIEMKKAGSAIMYVLLLFIALLAIFDTQVLSIFRRQREIGTYIALGMTRWQVVSLFTVEGSMYSLFAMFVGGIYGIPLLYKLAVDGFAINAASQDMGVNVADTIYPVYGFSLILGTLLLITISATIVSFMPARKIAKLDPVTALKGKIQ